MAVHRKALGAATAALALGAGVGSALAHEGPLGGPEVSVAPAGAHGQLGGVRAFPALAPVEGVQENVKYLSGDNGFTGGHVAIEGKRLYLGSYGLGLRIYDIADREDPKFLGKYTPGLRADTPPDAIQVGDRHIAVLNGTNRTHRSLPTNARTDRTEWLDVTDPANPRVLATVEPHQPGQPVDGESHNGDIVDERRLYFASGGSGNEGLRIYDINPVLGTPAAKPANVFRGNPTTLWESSPYRKGKPVGAAFTHTHDITIYPDMDVKGLGKRDIALLAEGGAYAGAGNTGSVFVIDVTDPQNPVVLQRWLHETGSGHHPIRYHHEAQFLDGDPRLMLVTDEDLHNGCGGAGGVVAVRLSDDLQGAVEQSEWFMPLGTPAPVCSVHVFSSKGTKVFFGSYNGGLQVVDYKDPKNPKRAGYFIAEGTTAWGAQVHKDVVYVGDMTRGLDVFRFTGKAGKPAR